MQWQDADNAPFAELHGPTLPGCLLQALGSSHTDFQKKKRKKKSLQEQEFHVNKHHTGTS